MCLMSWAEKLDTSAMRVVVEWNAASYAERTELLTNLGINTDGIYAWGSCRWMGLPGKIQVGLSDKFYGRAREVAVLPLTTPGYYEKILKEPANA